MEFYKVKLNDDNLQPYELEENNLGQIRIYDDGGITFKSEKFRVHFELSRDGLLGLGTELIRLAHNFRDGKHHHLDPVREGLASQTMGIFLTGDSCELIVGCKEFEGEIEDYFKK